MLIGYGIFILLIWVLFFRLPFNYSARSISGKVVDVDTGKPLEGTVVIAIWQLERGFGLEGDIPSGFMQVSEVVTDAEGNYFIEGWGPLRRPRGTYLGKLAPLLIYFRDGYINSGHVNYMNRVNYDNRRNSMQHSQWDGETIRLKEFAGNLEEYRNVLQAVSSSLDAVFNPMFGAKKCDWLRIPIMVSIFNQYGQRFIENNISSGLIPDLTDLNSENECGSDLEIQEILNKANSLTN